MTESQVSVEIKATSTRRQMQEATTTTLIVTITTESRAAAVALATVVDTANAGISTLGGFTLDSYTSAVLIYVDPDDDPEVTARAGAPAPTL